MCDAKTRNLPGFKTLVLFLLALLLFMTAGTSSVFAQAPSGSVYVVQPGDTFYGIATRHGITVQQLASINPGVHVYGFAVSGTHIQVPIPGLIGPTPSQCPQMHTVNPNETLGWIGGAYGVPVQQLAHINNLHPGSAVNPGNILCLPAYAALNFAFPGVGGPKPIPSPHPISIPVPAPGGPAILPRSHTPAGPWAVNFYHYQAPARLVLSRTDTAINFNWGHGSPGGGVRADFFSASWSNTFHFTGRNYRFAALSDDGVRVWVGDTLIIDGWVPQAATLYFKDYAPPAGTHLVRVEYYDSGANAQIMVDWAPH